MTPRGIFFLPFTAQTQHHRFRTGFANTLQIPCGLVVGYYNEQAPQAKFVLGSASLETVGGGIRLSAFTGLTPVAVDWEGDFESFWNLAPQLQIWNGTTYDFAYYVSNAWFDNGTDDGDYKEGWADTEGLLLGDDYEITPGYAYWLKNVPDSNPLNISGQVKQAEKVQVSCPNQFMLIGNPYPSAIDLNGKKDMTSTDIKPVAIDWEGDYTAFQNQATQLQIWNGSDYDMAYYVNNAWFDNGTEDGDYAEGWCDADGLLRVDYSIPTGYGLWIKATSGTCTIDFNNPIK